MNKFMGVTDGGGLNGKERKSKGDGGSVLTWQASSPLRETIGIECGPRVVHTLRRLPSPLTLFFPVPSCICLSVVALRSWAYTLYFSPSIYFVYIITQCIIYLLLYLVKNEGLRWADLPECSCECLVR